MRKAACSLLLLGCFIMPFLTGCWDGRELEKRAIVLMVGVDESDSGVRVSLQLARPQTMSGSFGESGGTHGSDPVVVVTRTGKNVTEALHAIQLSVDRELFFGHVRVVIVSEAAARKGVWGFLEPLVGGGMSIPRTAYFLVVNGKAEKVLAARPALDRIPSTYLTTFFDTRLLLQRTYDITVGGFHQRWVTPGEEPVAVWIAPLQEDRSAPAVLGIAAFDGDRFQGGLGWDESKGWVLTQNQQVPGRLSISCPKGDGTFTVRYVHSALRLRPYVSGGRLQRVGIIGTVSGRIDSAGCQLNDLSEANMAQFERSFQGEIARLLNLAFHKAQKEFGTDIFGFGKAVFRYAHPSWSSDAGWREQFKRISLGIDVDVHLDTNRTFAYPRGTESGGGNP